MRKLILLPLASVLLIACTKNKDKRDFEGVIERSKIVAKQAQKNLIERSTAAELLKSMSEEELDKARVQPVGPAPGVTTVQSNPTRMKLSELQDLLTKFNNGLDSGSSAAACGTYSDPSQPYGRQYLSFDYYTRTTQSVINAASKLSTIESIFEFVSHDIKNNLTFGATQSADLLLLSRRGSVIDKANLLVALLRANNIPAQFIQGEIYLRAETATRMFDVPYVGDVFQIVSNFFFNYFETNYARGARYYTSVDGERYLSVPHVWVRAYNGNQWINLDPTQLASALSATQSKGLINSSVSLDLNQWLFGKDTNDDYIKIKSSLDFMLENANIQTSIGYVNGRKDIFSRSSDDGVLSDHVPCIRQVLTGFEGSDFEFRAEVFVQDTSGVERLRINQPMAKISESNSYLSHTAGLYSEITQHPTQGYVQFTVGTNVMGQFAAGTGETFKVKAIYHLPAAMSKFSDPVSFHNVYLAGGVWQINFFSREVGEAELIRGIEVLEDDLNSQVNNKLIEARLLRLAGLLAQYKQGRLTRQEKLLRGVNITNDSMFATFTNFGKIVTTSQEDRQFSLVPTQPGVDWLYSGSLVSAPYEELGYAGYDKVLSLVNSEYLIGGSQILGTIWEELFGLRGYSAERVCQVAAKANAANPSYPNDYYFLKGVDFNSTNNSAISSHLLGAMQAEFPSIEAVYGSPGYSFWGPNKEVLDSDSGALLLAYIVNGGAYHQGMTTFRVLNYSPTLVKNYRSQISAEEPAVPESGKQSNVSSTRKTNNSQTPEMQGDGMPPWGGSNTGSGLDNYDSILNPIQGKQTASLSNSPYGSAVGPASCFPVDMVTGEMWHRFTDLSLLGHTENTGLQFQRTYLTTKQYNTNGSWVDQGDLGKGWIHNFDTRLLDGSKTTCPTPPGSCQQILSMGPLSSSTTDILWITETGAPVLFTLSNGQYTPPQGVVASLQAAGSTLVLTLKGNLKHVFNNDPASAFRGRLIKIIDPHGEELNLSYDSNGRLDTVTSPFAKELKFHRDSSNKLSSVENVKNGIKVSFTYQDGKLASSFDVDRHQTVYRYNVGQTGTQANGLLQSFTDPLNRTIRFEYYKNGRVFKSVGLGDSVQAYNYAPYLYQKYTRIVSPNGETTEYRYDNSYRVVLEVKPNGGRIYRKWTSDGRVEWEKDALGNKSEFTYDARGNRTGIKKPIYTGFVQTNYDGTFDKPTLVTPRIGSSTVINVSAQAGDVLSTSRGSASNSFTRSNFGLLLGTTTSLGKYSHIANSDGFIKNRFHSRNPEDWSYDSRGRVIERNFASGRALHYAYDNFDRVTYVNDTDGPDVRNTYDAGGRLIKREHIAGGTAQTTTFEYNQRDRLIAQTNAAGERTEYKHDIVGTGCLTQDKVTQIVAPDGKRTRYEYDLMGNKTKEVSPDGSENNFAYNLRGDLVAVMDANGNLTQFEYDGNGRLIKTLRQSAGLHKNTGAGKTISEIPETTTYEYDEADRLTKKKQMLVSEQNVDGAYVTEFVYDDLDRLIQKIVSHKRGALTVESLDQVNYEYLNQLYPPLLSKITNRYLALHFAYESQPPYALLSYSEEPTDKGKAIGLKSHRYDVTPSVSSSRALVTRDGNRLIYNKFDPSGRLVSSSGSLAGYSSSSVVSYDTFKRRSAISHAAGQSVGYIYDLVGRLTNLTWSGTGVNTSESLSYAKSGLINQLTREFGSFNYGFDKKNQVASIAYSGSQSLDDNYVNASLSYDPAGNILNYGNRNFSSFNNFTTKAGSVDYVPDSNGLGRVRATDDGVVHKEIEYLPEGQIRKLTVYSVSTGDVQSSTSYYYDGLNRRIAKILSVPGQPQTTATYSYVGAANRVLLGSLNKGTMSNEVLYVDGTKVDDHLSEISSSTGVKNYVTDHLGSVLNSVATGGKSTYGPFGNNLGAAPSNTSLVEPVTFGFAGREYDAESGFYYNRARYYNPDTGTFLSKDPLMAHEGGDINPYRYVGNNPMCGTDPSGAVGLSDVTRPLTEVYNGTIGGIRSGNPGRTIASVATIMANAVPSGAFLPGAVAYHAGLIDFDTERRINEAMIIGGLAAAGVSSGLMTGAGLGVTTGVSAIEATYGPGEYIDNFLNAEFENVATGIAIGYAVQTFGIADKLGAIVGGGHEEGDLAIKLIGGAYTGATIYNGISQNWETYRRTVGLTY